MKKLKTWDYMIHRERGGPISENRLQGLGLDGWELTAVVRFEDSFVQYRYYFKREIL